MGRSARHGWPHHWWFHRKVVTGEAIGWGPSHLFGYLWWVGICTRHRATFVGCKFQPVTGDKIPVMGFTVPAYHRCEVSHLWHVEFVCPSNMTKKSLFFPSLPNSEARPYPLLLFPSPPPLSLQPTTAGWSNGCRTLSPPSTDEHRVLPPPLIDCGRM